jgi:hypothetical protein
MLIYILVKFNLTGTFPVKRGKQMKFRLFGVFLTMFCVFSVVPGYAWATDYKTPITSEGTDNLAKDEVEVPPQPSAGIYPRCDQLSVYDHRQFLALAELDTAVVDRWATFRLIARGKAGVNATPVTVSKFDIELGPGEFRNDLAVFAMDTPRLVGKDGKIYNWVRPVVKLVQKGKNQVLADWKWNRAKDLFWASSCNRSFYQKG